MAEDTGPRREGRSDLQGHPRPKLPACARCCGGGTCGPWASTGPGAETGTLTGPRRHFQRSRYSRRRRHVQVIGGNYCTAQPRIPVLALSHDLRLQAVRRAAAGMVGHPLWRRQQPRRRDQGKVPGAVERPGRLSGRDVALRLEFDVRDSLVSGPRRKGAGGSRQCEYGCDIDWKKWLGEEWEVIDELVRDEILSPTTPGPLPRPPLPISAMCRRRMTRPTWITERRWVPPNGYCASRSICASDATAPNPPCRRCERHCRDWNQRTGRSWVACPFCCADVLPDLLADGNQGGHESAFARRCTIGFAAIGVASPTSSSRFLLL